MTAASIVQPAALSAWHNLGALLADLADAGRTPPCRIDPEPFTSEDHGERAEAAQACRGACPVIGACAAFATANSEPVWVWGGIDRTARPAKRKAVA